MSKKIEVCGAFNAYVSPRKGETAAMAAERFEMALQSVLDRFAKSYDVRVGVDYGALLDIEELNQKETLTVQEVSQYQRAIGEQK